MDVKTKRGENVKVRRGKRDEEREYENDKNYVRDRKEKRVYDRTFKNGSTNATLVEPFSKDDFDKTETKMDEGTKNDGDPNCDIDGNKMSWKSKKDKIMTYGN